MESGAKIIVLLAGYFIPFIHLSIGGREGFKESDAQATVQSHG